MDNDSSIPNMKLSFEDVLVGGYKICLMIFTLWLGWVIFDEVKMQRDAVTTLAQVAKASSASAYESAFEGECYLHGRSANCRDRNSLVINYQAGGNNYQAELSNILSPPGEHPSICINYVKNSPDIVKRCESRLFNQHKDYVIAPLIFWSFNLIGAFFIALFYAGEKIKRQFADNKSGNMELVAPEHNTDIVPSQPAVAKNKNKKRSGRRKPTAKSGFKARVR